MGKDSLDFRHAIRLARISQSITLQDLAKKSGISSSYIARIEKGASRPSIFITNKLAEALGMKMEVLLKISSSDL
jgi:transcriptional regulator with XRE-family HTH domain